MVVVPARLPASLQSPSLLRSEMWVALLDWVTKILFGSACRGSPALSLFFPVDPFAFCMLSLALPGIALAGNSAYSSSRGQPGEASSNTHTTHGHAVL